MIKVISKKTLAFRNPDNKAEIVTVKPLEYASLPEWVKGDKIFHWAVKDGTLTVTNATENTQKITQDTSEDETVKKGKTK